MSEISTSRPCASSRLLRALAQASTQHKLIDFLSAWRSEQPTFLERIKHLATDMAAAKFWHGDEATAIERWVEDLRAIGYVEAPLYDWESDMNQALLIAASGESWYTPNTETRSERNHGLQLPIFNYSPAQRQSTYLSDSVRPAQLAPLPAANDNLEGCPFSDIEAHLATIWASRDMFANLIDSWLGAMCVLCPGLVRPMCETITRTGPASQSCTSPYPLTRSPCLRSGYRSAASTTSAFGTKRYPRRSRRRTTRRISGRTLSWTATVRHFLLADVYC